MTVGWMRTALFVPGDRPDRVAKAIGSAADVVIVDLEDAVAASQKAVARSLTVEAIRAVVPYRPGISVRVNALESGLLETDLTSLAPVWARLDLIVVPMVPDAATTLAVEALMVEADHAAGGGSPLLLPLIETASGVVNAVAIANASRRVYTLGFGPGDLSNELGVTITAGGKELLVARSHVVLAAAAARRARPIDGPWLELDDAEGLDRSAAAARALGFGGKMLIHPSQIHPVARAFLPTAEQLAWAGAVVEAFERAEAGGVSSIRLDDGTFVDYPIASRARALLAESSSRDSA